jgi:hypothetical protein
MCCGIARAATRPHPPCVLSDISGWSLSFVGLVPRAAPTCNNMSRLLADVTDFLFSECRIGARAELEGAAPSYRVVRNRRAVVKRAAVHRRPLAYGGRLTVRSTGSLRADTRALQSNNLSVLIFCRFN